MIPYLTKVKKLPGTSYAEVRKNAEIIFKQIKSKTKRKPYIRSAYFNKQKIFFDYFWRHLNQKGPKERFKRLKYFGAALEVIKNSRNQPISKQNPNKETEILHRFAGLTKEKELFYVQIKEDKRSGKKYFMSCFPPG
jgi:hypothetical protein